MVSSDAFAVAMCHRWLYFVQETFAQTFLLNHDGSGKVVVLLLRFTYYFCWLLFAEKFIYFFMLSRAVRSFFVVVIAVAVSAAFSVFCNRMRECVRALSFGLLYVDLFNEFALFFETFHFNLFSTLLNCITYSFFYILSQVVFIVGFNEYFLFSLSNFFLNRFVL